MATKKIVLEAIPETDVFRATINGKPAIVAYHTRNRNSEERANSSVTMREVKLNSATALAKTEKAVAYVGVQVSVKKRWNSGWLIPMSLFKKFKQGEFDFALSKKAQAAYGADEHSLTEVHFVVG
jgi:hypothetical protein